MINRSSYDYKMRHFAGVLRAWMNTHGVTAVKLSAVSGVSDQAISRILNYYGTSEAVRERVRLGCKEINNGRTICREL